MLFSSIISSILRRLKFRRGVKYYFTFIGFAIVLSFVLMALLASFISPYNPVKRAGAPLESPSFKFPMGTDGLGRDILSRIIHGTRIVLRITLLSMTLSFLIGVPIGLLSGYLGGKLDSVISLFMDSLYAFPGLVLAIALAVMLGPGEISMGMSLTVVYIPTYFRMVRGEALSVKENLFVEAAKAIGAKDRTVMFKYILPNIIPSLPIILSLNAADAVLTAAALSFIGLGITAPTPDWGFDLRMGYPYLTSKIWWPSTFPGLMIVFLTLGFSLFGEGLTEILNPRLVRR
ncbi:ABC transporter permease [Candidatus Bathyarchaeota archaeon]|nr:ABC transporter permease [Candidatus Bathyarchaeota archaeon]MBS7617666.1 ABC transporter permease [Candidatus Bathyarchaeota archaeon]